MMTECLFVENLLKKSNFMQLFFIIQVKNVTKNSLCCMPSYSHPQSFHSCWFHIYSIREPVSGFCVSITSFDLATRLWIWYLISLYDVATSTSSLIRAHDNAVLIGTGRLCLLRELTACRSVFTGEALREHMGQMLHKSDTLVYFRWSCQFN